ncbi:hypothetical protein pb186bvf_007370 [Paramecium bursaria]
MISQRWLAKQFTQAFIQHLHPIYPNSSLMWVNQTLNQSLIRYNFSNYNFKDDQTQEYDFQDRQNNSTQNNFRDQNRENRYSSNRDNRDSRSYGDNNNRSYGQRRIQGNQRNKSDYQLKQFQINYFNILNEEQHGEINKDFCNYLFEKITKKDPILKEHQINGDVEFLANNFECFELDLQDKIKLLEIIEPSLIQRISLPIVLQGHDLISIAKTGSGKTLAFALPSIAHTRAQPQCKGPRVVILEPTRELAQQTYEVYKKFTSVAFVVGGQNKEDQYYHLSKFPKVIVATPGRLIDMINDGLNLQSVTQLILDEADTMLDMGFTEQVLQISEKIRKDRQTLFFSATWPKNVEKFANDLCSQSPKFVQIGNYGLSTNKDIQQEFLQYYDESEKYQELVNIINKSVGQKIMIFCSTRKDTEKLDYQLNRQGIKSSFINRDLTQNQRFQVLGQFRSGEVKCMIATNVAARGLDIKDVDIVINYEFPQTIDEYIHRIGRTARAGKEGRSITFIRTRDVNPRTLRDLQFVLKQSQQPIPDFL